MNKTELINAVAEEASLAKKDAEAAVTACIDVITNALKERVGRNPKTLEPIQIPASKSPVFKAGKALKDAVAE